MILDAKQLRGHGPFIGFYCLKRKINDPGSWINARRARNKPFYEMADDLLTVLCAFTKSFCFFDPYGEETLSKPSELQAFAQKLLEWELSVLRGKDKQILLRFSCFNCYKRRKHVTAFEIKADLCETLTALAHHALSIANKKQHLFIFGI